MPGPRSASAPSPGVAGSSLRVALLTYRGNPRSGGQGVYVHYLSRELAALGHRVTVFSGPPYPDLAPGVELVQVPSLDLYRSPDPFRRPRREEFRDAVDVLEYSTMCAGGFPEPLTFSLRVRRELRARAGRFDLVHDNQGLGYGLLATMSDGMPLMATVHHPITVDRDLELARADNWHRRWSVQRWYGFIAMQQRVLSRIPRVLTVSESSARDLCAQMGARPEQLSVVPVGVDTDLFRPLDHVRPVPGRVMTTASADVPLKGLVPLLEAVAKVRTERAVELVVVGPSRAGSDLPAIISRLGLDDVVTLAGAIEVSRMVELYSQAEVAVVPSLYEGFSLPAIEAMACGVALVATTGGALPEVAGPDGEAALLVAPGDPGSLAQAIGRALDDADLRRRLGASGRQRVTGRYSWSGTARGTAEHYRELLADGSPGRRRGAEG